MGLYGSGASVINIVSSRLDTRQCTQSDSGAKQQTPDEYLLLFLMLKYLH